jgi:hypothetical protein
VRPKVVKKPNGEHPKDEIPIPLGESIHSLIERDIPRPATLCNPWATEGINLIVGRPKLGKTTLARQKMVAAAIAGDYLDSKFPQAVKCAFLSLEEGELLCRTKFMDCGFPEAALASIQSFFEWPRGDMGVKLLDRYLEANPEVKYVCIDSLTRFRVIPDVRTPAFMADYEAVNQLHEMSKKHPGVCIDIVHHARKSKSDDPMDDVSGTYGLTAAADCITVLRSHLDGVVLYVYSRLWDREENQYSLRRGPRRTWEMIGIHLDITDEQKEAFQFISDAGINGSTGKELGDKVGITPQSAWGRIDGLIEKGLVVKRFGRVYKK